jgi:CRP/FNR family transcriptional regulator, cyclic AMP receptor protein
LRPGPRKLKQSLPVIVGFGVAGRKHRLFSVLPELICYRHGHPPVREGCLNGHPLRVTTATAIEQSLITRIPKAAMIATLHDEVGFSELFMADLLNRNSRIEEDLIDQLFNSSEKRLARVLLLLANFGKEATAEPIIGNFSQETLAKMIGTTRSRVSFFMNKFRKLGYIEYNGKLEIRNSLLNVVLYDKPEIRKDDASEGPR